MAQGDPKTGFSSLKSSLCQSRRAHAREHGYKLWHSQGRCIGSLCPCIYAGCSTKFSADTAVGARCRGGRGGTALVHAMYIQYKVL